MTSRRRTYSIGVAVDWFFFVFAGAAALWLAYLSLTETFHVGWWGIPFFIAFWALLAYLVLPRLHRILTTIYVPDYFIGRTRTSDGLLGDPVNLAFLGTGEQIQAALAAAGWTRADPVTLGSSWRIIASTLTRRSYDEAPVSPLFLFGRQQDFAYQQEVAGNPAQRHHVRFWRCPDGWLLPGGRRVDWLAAGTFDTRVGLSLFTLQVTHKIDADTDVERDHIVSTVRTADPRVDVDVIADFATGYHARNGGGDSIRTDGDLPIVDVRAVPAGDVDAGAADGARHE
ncbi:LssY C-terminal domain-containing protein [Microbacterium sp. NEAU-LLC]|uniref:LssY C-terminal domain-containing protein n=1 Tax=Microbacterium helvum TaxID=2773713 RepID=A0ABR8NNZ7_9MICO|nr:LssY C-terminal domain-containing protein [Microbacterium helvum]MBD3942173.1 LssY C-terminal domain-containing protein [Microbacterium helvum]